MIRSPHFRLFGDATDESLMTCDACLCMSCRHVEKCPQYGGDRPLRMIYPYEKPEGVPVWRNRCYAVCAKRNGAGTARAVFPLLSRARMKFDGEGAWMRMDRWDLERDGKALCPSFEVELDIKLTPHDMASVFRTEHARPR